MAKGLIFLQIAMEVSPAKARTSLDLEPLCWMAAGRHSLKYTSETRIPDSAMAFTVVRAARASASSVLAALATRTSIGKDSVHTNRRKMSIIDSYVSGQEP